MKKDNWILKNLIIGAVVVSAILVLTIIILKTITRHNQEQSVPDFSGMTIAQAMEKAEQANLRLEVTDSVFMPRMERGVIFRQNPVFGSMVKKNRRVILTINSLQPKRVNMPSVTGFSLRQAKAELSGKQLKVGKLIYTQDMATNNVLAQLYNGKEIPAGTMIETESEIDLRLGMSWDNNMTSVPSVMGYSLLTAKDILTDNSLNLGTLTYDSSVKTYSDTLSSFVIRQAPTPTDSLAFRLGAVVNLTLSIDKSKLTEEQQ
ncbi:MAG: PASTA domain-containing protein [Bacteroidales bacterium]